MSKSQFEEKTSEPKKVSLKKCNEQINLFKEWQKDYFSTRLANLTVEQQQELHNDVTGVIKTAEDRVKEFSNQKKHTKFEVAQFLEQLTDMRVNVQLDFHSKKLQQEHLNKSRDDATQVCIQNAMSHLKYEHDLKKENSLSVQLAADE